LRSNKEMFALKEHVANVCFECFRCFRCMLQVFYTNIAKIDWDVTYVAMVVYVCCKGLLPMFHLCFRTYVAYVFIWMLHMFHTYVECVLSEYCVCLQRFSGVFGCFFQVFQKHVASVCFKCFSSFQTYVARVLSECCMCCSGYTYML
jgi:hypothetical protein